MEPFKSILVDVDSTASAHPALERAVLPARSSGATLTITDVMTVPPARAALSATGPRGGHAHGVTGVAIVFVGV